MRRRARLRRTGGSGESGRRVSSAGGRSLRSWMMGVAGAAAVLAAWPAGANVFSVDGRDPRVPQPRGSAPFGAIGVISNDHPIPVIAEDNHVRYAPGRATAFLASPCP